jgi:hypothetical protein
MRQVTQVKPDINSVGAWMAVGSLCVHSGLHFITFHKGNGGAGRRGGQEEEEGEEEEGTSLKEFYSLSQEATETWLPMTFTFTSISLFFFCFEVCTLPGNEVGCCFCIVHSEL